MFFLTLIIFILLYINIKFLIHNYIFLLDVKNTLITLTYLFFCVKKNLFDLQRGESNRNVNTLFICFFDIDCS